MNFLLPQTSPSTSLLFDSQPEFIKLYLVPSIQPVLLISLVNPLSPSQPLHLSLAGIAAASLPSFILPHCLAYWTFLVNFGFFGLVSILF